jgi:3D (Asp-Asp-Asp) domain-containing protein
MWIATVVVFLIYPILTADCSLNCSRKLSMQKGAEVYLFATGYYHPEEDQNFYATGSYKRDMELNGRGITASGKRVEKGHAAVDVSVIPLGTEFYTEEHGILKAEDTGGRIKGNRIDIFTGRGKKGLIKALKINGWLKLRIVKWGNEESSDTILAKRSKARPYYDRMISK